MIAWLRDMRRRSNAKLYLSERFTPRGDKPKWRQTIENCPPLWQKEVDLPEAKFVCSWTTYGGTYIRAYLDKNYSPLLVQMQHDFNQDNPPPLKTYWRAWTP